MNSRMIGAGRAVLMRAMQYYVERIPIERGKGRLLSLLGPWCAASDDFIIKQMPDGFSMELSPHDYIQAWLLFRGHYEPAVVKFIRSRVQAGMDVVDVGAHVGFMTLVLATCVAATDVVHAFEPDLRNREHLLRHVQLNGLKNVNVRSEALSNRNGLITFYPSRETKNRGLGSLRPRGHGLEATIECPTTRLDDYVLTLRPERRDRIGFIKVDVEGAEFEVLRGAEGVLATGPTIVLEFVKELAVAFGYSFQELNGWMRDRKYKCFQLDGGKLKELRPADIPSTTEIVCIGENLGAK